ncbi:MAG: DUF1802 family protein, partial [Thermoplasmatales archaeon]|nr:DUF1802 family protein [Thermoplasmatales archaeon]
GQGKQTIIIRKYKTQVKKFLLFPTFSYALKDDYLKNFQKKHRKFVKKHAFPKKEDKKTEIKYFVICEKMIEGSSKKIGDLEDYFIWNKRHVRSYLNNKNGYIWLMRVYKLKRPYMVRDVPGMTFANLKEGISVEGSQSILSDKEFSKISREIESKMI